MGYTKLFNSILASTVWRAKDKTRLVWITLLAMTDKYGIVETSTPGLADFARVSLADCEKALKELQAPDPYSRSKALEGRRIEPVDGGWRIVNHAKYRDKMNLDERREYLKNKQREQRVKKSLSQQPSTNVNIGSEPLTESTHTDPDPDPDPYSDPDPERARATRAREPRYGSPIIGRNTHLNHAACDPTLSYCVPVAVHRKLIDAIAPRHGGDREAARSFLETWYATVWTSLPADCVMGDAFKFWQGHFDAAFASATPRAQAPMMESAEAMAEGMRKILRKEGAIK